MAAQLISLSTDFQPSLLSSCSYSLTYQLYSTSTQAAMTDRLRLYTAPAAYPNPQRVRLLMHEKGITDKVEEVLLDLSPVGDQRSWQHLNRNPWGEAPTLQFADGTYLAESVAIARYLDQSFDGRRIMGNTPREVAEDTM